MSSASPARADMRELQREAVREVGLSMALAKSMTGKELIQAVQAVRLARSKAQQAATDARIKARKALKRAKAPTPRVGESIGASLARFEIPRL